MDRQRIVQILVSAAPISGMVGSLVIARPAAASRLHSPTVFISTCTVMTAPTTTYLLTASAVSAGPCIVIRASNITLNLNGHSVSGAAGTGRGVVIASATTVVNENVYHWGISVDDLGKDSRLIKLQLKNKKFDLFDSNPRCGRNTWSSDTATSRNPPCTI